MKYILRFFVLLIAMALDTTAMPALEFMGGFPLLSFTIVLALAMHGGAMETVITAAAVGAVTDLLYQSVFGLNLLLYMYIGLIVWVVHQFIYTKNIAMACLYTFIATVVFQGFYALFGFVIFGQSVPSANRKAEEL